MLTRLTSITLCALASLRESFFNRRVRREGTECTENKLNLSAFASLCEYLFNHKGHKAGTEVTEKRKNKSGLRVPQATFIFSLFLLTTSFGFSQRDSSTIINYIDQCNKTYYANPDSSFEFCLKAEKESKYQGNFSYAGDIALCKSRYHILVTDYETANAELTFAINCFEQKKNFAKLSKAMSLKSILLDRIGEHYQSTKVLREAYLISKNNGDKPGEISRLINLTLDFIDHQAADSAYKYLLILESLGSDVKDENLYFMNQNLGLYYNMIEDHTKAIYYYQRAKEVSEKFQMTDSKATILARLSESYRKLKMYTEAELAGVESEEISIRHNLVFEERDAVEQLVLLYEANGDFASAFNYQRKLIDVDERINKIEKVQKLKEEEYKSNIALKEKVLAEKELSIQEEQLKSEKAESRNWILASVILLVVVVLGFTIVIYLRTKKMNQAIELSKIILEQKNREVTDSINYARQIQEAILAPKKYYQSLFKEIFVFYRPKDIVAGDFYWFYKSDSRIYFAAADCTGHGVPGAMVSVICHSALNRCVKEFDLKSPAEILDKTSLLVQDTFSKSDRTVKDGMDIALCVLDTKTNVLQFAGANNPVWVIKKIDSPHITALPAKGMLVFEEKILVELKGSKQAIGYDAKKQPFLNHELQLEQGDAIYISTDGFIDQFGGEKGKKFKSKFFKQKLLQVQKNSIAEQETMLSSIFDQWKGEFEQVDDVCVLAIRITD